MNPESGPDPTSFQLTEVGSAWEKASWSWAKITSGYE